MTTDDSADPSVQSPLHPACGPVSELAEGEIDIDVDFDFDLEIVEAAPVELAGVGYA